ncbi:MAG: glycosyltransferase, partial [Nanoarchaeota archaeon]|nr:glycosyltransferase [Nanoarchaeota archaeon]
QKIHQLYNDHFKEFGDAAEPVYRYIYLALKPEFSTLAQELQHQLIEIDVTDVKQRKILDVMVEELTKGLNSHEIFLKEKDTHIQNLDADLEEKGINISTLNHELDLKENHMKNVGHELELKENHVKNLDQELRHRAYLLEQATARQAQLEDWQTELNTRLVKAVSNIERKETEINQLNFSTVQYQTKLDKQNQLIQQLKSTIEDKDRHIANIEPSFLEMQKLSASPSFKILQFLGKIKHRLTHDVLMARNILKYEGLGAFLGSLGRYVTGNLKEPVTPPTGELSPQQQYKVFLSKQLLLDEAKIKKETQQWSYQPLISIVVPVYNVKAEWLNACIKSVQAQLYTKWELCLYDDASTDVETIDWLKSWQGKDARIKIGFGKKNLHISGATNEAIKLATGEFVGLLDNDDELTRDALYEVVKALNANRDLGFIYSDEDKLEPDGTLSDPHFKPDFNLDLLLSINYLSHFGVVRKEIGDRLGWFRVGFEGSQDYDLYLRVIEQTKHIHHIQKVLYHWRKVPGSTAAVYAGKNYVDEASIRALTEYLKRNHIQGVVKKIENSAAFRVERTILDPELVSIIIPFQDKVELLK